MSNKRSPIASAARKVGVGAVGVITVALGVVLLPLPGPGTLVILGGLTMLGSEYPTARKASAAGWRTVGRLLRCPSS